MTAYPANKRMLRPVPSVVKPKKVKKFATLPPLGSGFNALFDKPAESEAP